MDSQTEKKPKATLELPTVRQLLEKQRKAKEVFSTGSLFLDLAIEQEKNGIFGVPSRTILEAFGYQRTGKTLLGESIARSVLAADPRYECVFLLAEEPNYERMIVSGLDIDRIKAWSFKQDEEALRKNPDSFVTAETGMNYILDYIRRGWRNTDKDGNPTKDSRIVKYVMVDSVSALVADTDVRDGRTIREMDDKELPAIRARLMKRFLLR